MMKSQDEIAIMNIALLQSIQIIQQLSKTIMKLAHPSIRVKI